MKIGHTWKLKQRLRRSSFGWRGSARAIKRLNEALAEIKQVGRKDSVLAAEGALLLAERLWPAFEGIDTSSGALGNAAYRTVEQLVAVLLVPSVDLPVRAAWMERLFEAVEEDGVDYLSGIQENWGPLCVFPALAHQWADRLIPHVRLCWQSTQYYSIKHGILALSAMVKAGCHEEIAELLKLQSHRFWHYERFLAESLAAQGRVDEALALAEESDWGINDYSDGSRMAFCERILLAAGRREEAYARYCFAGTGLTNNTTIYRRVLEKYPEKEPRSVLLHIMGKVKGKWFAAAKDAGFLDIALECAEHPAADPTTLTRAARDFVQSEPGFALRVAFAAVRGLLQGSGYDPKNGDMYRTYHYGMTAAAKLEKQAEFEQSLKDLARAGATEDRRMMLGALWHCLKRGPADIANTVAIIDMRPPRRGK